MGDNTQIKRLAPVQVFPYRVPTPNGGEKSPSTPQAKGPKVTAIRVGLYFSCVSLSDGEYKCWGSNSQGQLGNDRRRDQNPIPITVEDKSKVAPLFAKSPLLGCVKDQCERLLGQFPSLYGASAVMRPTTTDNALCGIKNGRVVCADKDGSGLRFTVHNLHDVVFFDQYGGDHGCAVVADGRVKCWGSNSHGQLGIGTKAPFTYLYKMPIASTIELQ